jgi:hypothetical protein
MERRPLDQENHNKVREKYFDESTAIRRAQRKAVSDGAWGIDNEEGRRILATAITPQCKRHFFRYLLPEEDTTCIGCRDINACLCPCHDYRVKEVSDEQRDSKGTKETSSSMGD